MTEHASANHMRAWCAKHQRTARDLPAFYAQVIRAIREIDGGTPIMVESGWYGAADAFSYWPNALADKRVLYSFHMYEPYAATSAPNLKRAKPYAYPGLVPFADDEETWNAARVKTYLQSANDWAVAHGVPPNRIVAGEFGCVRMLPGCRTYLEDVLTVFDEKRWHWAFYSFREDSWDGMDYELGNNKVPWSYWKAINAHQPDRLQRRNTSEFEPIRRRLSGESPH